MRDLWNHIWFSSRPGTSMTTGRILMLRSSTTNSFAILRAFLCVTWEKFSSRLLVTRDKELKFGSSRPLWHVTDKQFMGVQYAEFVRISFLSDVSLFTWLPLFLSFSDFRLNFSQFLNPVVSLLIYLQCMSSIQSKGKAEAQHRRISSDHRSHERKWKESRKRYAMRCLWQNCPYIQCNRLDTTGATWTVGYKSCLYK